MMHIGLYGGNNVVVRSSPSNSEKQCEQQLVTSGGNQNNNSSPKRKVVSAVAIFLQVDNQSEGNECCKRSTVKNNWWRTRTRGECDFSIFPRENSAYYWCFNGHWRSNGTSPRQVQYKVGFYCVQRKFVF